LVRSIKIYVKNHAHRPFILTGWGACLLSRKKDQRATHQPDFFNNNNLLKSISIVKPILSRVKKNFLGNVKLWMRRDVKEERVQREIGWTRDKKRPES
jgi:hypothetical protein